MLVINDFFVQISVYGIGETCVCVSVCVYVFGVRVLFKLRKGLRHPLTWRMFSLVNTTHSRASLMAQW